MSLDIAIVGFGGVFPGAESPQDFWSNIERGNDAVVEVPSGRWYLDPDEAYSSEIASADRVYARRAGLLLEIDLDTDDLGIDAHLLDRLDPMFKVALRAAQMAVADGLPETLDRDRTGVIFGNIVLPTDASSSSGTGDPRSDLCGAPRARSALSPRPPSPLIAMWRGFPRAWWHTPWACAVAVTRWTLPARRHSTP